jgi:hypothetical protein
MARGSKLPNITISPANSRLGQRFGELIEGFVPAGLAQFAHLARPGCRHAAEWALSCDRLLRMPLSPAILLWASESRNAIVWALPPRAPRHAELGRPQRHDDGKHGTDDRQSDEDVCEHGTSSPCSAPHAQASTRTLNPPQNMRLPSKGMAVGSIIFARRGSFITLALTRSRCARDLYTM